MKSIKVLGADNCSTCVNLFKKIETMIKEKNLDAEVIKVTDVMEVMKYGVMSTPAVVVDEQLKCFARVPSQEELISWVV